MASPFKSSTNSDSPLKVEQDLLQATKDLKNRNEELLKINEELNKSNAELAQFAYAASHDLQEPLRMVASYTQLLTERYQKQLDEDAQQFIRYAAEGALRAQQLVNDLLEFSRLHRVGKEFAPADCNNLLRIVLANLKLSIQETSAVITNDPLPTVYADDVQIAQVFQNLLNNAIKFRKGAPRIHISAKKRDQDWLFMVQDNGIGIDPQFAHKIFVIFQRLHTHEEYPGAGIGLAMCKKIIERHGGKIWFDSHLGAGTTFFFTIAR